MGLRHPVLGQVDWDDVMNHMCEMEFTVVAQLHVPKSQSQMRF